MIWRTASIPIQDSCYPGTTVLVNKLHIHDEAAPYVSGG